MGWIGCIRCEKFRHDFVAWSFALIAPVQPIMHQVSCSNEMVPNAPKHYETQQKLSLGSMVWIRCVRWEKFRRDFVARTFALVRPILHRVLWGNQTVLNAPKWYETHQNVSLRSNGMDRMRSLRKIPTQVRGTNFCTSWACFAQSFVRQPNGPECTQIVRNAPKCQFRVQWGGSGVRCEKFRRDFVARTFAQVRPVFHRVS